MYTKCFLSIFLFFVLLNSDSYSEKNSFIRIDDINGTWIDSNSYNYIITHPGTKKKIYQRGFSWGKGKTILNTTNEFDLNTKPFPFFFESSIGHYRVKDIKITSSDLFFLTIYRVDEFDNIEPYSVNQLVVHFLDPDTCWFESVFLENMGLVYKHKALWYKISGPPRIEPFYGTINDSRVRIRTKPSLQSDTWGFLNRGDAVRIIDKSDKPFVIEGVESYWYKVDAEGYPDGWVFGQFITIK